MGERLSNYQDTIRESQPEMSSAVPTFHRFLRYSKDVSKTKQTTSTDSDVRI